MIMWFLLYAVMNFLRMYDSMLQFISLLLSCFNTFSWLLFHVCLFLVHTACPLNCCPSQEVVPRFKVMISLCLKERILGAGTVCQLTSSLTLLVMGWLTKILKGSSYKGHSHRKYGHDRTWDEPRDSVVITLLTFTKFLLFLLHIE